MSRAKKDSQAWFVFRDSNLSITRQYFEKYESISEILDGLPRLVDLVHHDLEALLTSEGGRGPAPRFTTEQILRVLVCQRIESLSLRDTVVRIDDSHCLREFTRIHGGAMMDYTTLCRFDNAIREETWERINAALTKYAVSEGLVSGEKLRMDTTAVETDIHWPSDSHLLYDTYRVLARLIISVRDLAPQAVGNRRLRLDDMKRCHNLIGRAARKGKATERAQKPYRRLIAGVEGILEWSQEVVPQLEELSDRYLSVVECDQRRLLVTEMRRYVELGTRVVWQASQRVLEGNKVAASDKLFSIFEPHTEILIRGKASRNIEYGHMVGIEQVGGKFITHYDVFPHRPNEHRLLLPAIERHRKIFGKYPDEVAADKGYWPGTEGLPSAESKVKLVSIGKMGRRNEEETQRESDPAFMESQKFRAGVEGTISFLKRILGLARCLRRGWAHFVSNVGATIFAHNLLILARG